LKEEGTNEILEYMNRAPRTLGISAYIHAHEVMEHIEGPPYPACSVSQKSLGSLDGWRERLFLGIDRLGR
jgi:hypothetical protein